MSDIALNANEMLAYLGEVAEALPQTGPRHTIVVLGAPLRQVFVMKLFAARARTRDHDDLVALWPRCGFASAEEAVELYRAAYPHEAEDPHLVEYVRGLSC